MRACAGLSLLQAPRAIAHARAADGWFRAGERAENKQQRPGPGHQEHLVSHVSVFPSPDKWRQLKVGVILLALAVWANGMVALRGVAGEKRSAFF